jgi:hypothetical protein
MLCGGELAGFVEKVLEGKRGHMPIVAVNG